MKGVVSDTIPFNNKIKIKKNQQWNPAVDWISIAQQGDQF